MNEPRPQGVVGFAVGLVAAVVALGPALLHRGYVLSYDMVFVPHPPITAATLGGDGSVPRAVPNDLVVALLALAVPADIVQKLLLVAVFVLGASGVARLMPTRTAALVAAVTFVWNPFVYERLVIGHWGFLLGYALLPWVVGGSVAARRGTGRDVARLCLLVAVTGLAGSTPLVLATLTALAVVAVPGHGERRGRAAAWLLVTAAGSAAAWLVPALTRADGVPADPAGVAAFAAQADTPLGVLPSVLGLGGIWNEAVWPAERQDVVVAVAGLLFVLAVLVVGGPRLARSWDGAGLGVLLAGGLGLVLGVAGAVPGLESLLREVVVHVPGGGLLRDGQKFAALLGVPVAACAGLAAEVARGRLGRAALLVAVAPVVLLPSLAWGAGERLTPVRYPGEWQTARAVVDRAGGDAAVFPFRYYRRFAWNDDRVVLDPMPRFLPTGVVVNDDLPLTTVTVRGEDPRAARIRAALAGGGDLPAVLRREGVGLVVVHTGEADPDKSGDRLAGLPVLFAGRALRVLSVPDASPPPGAHPPWGLAVTALTLLGAVVATGVLGGGSPASLRRRGAVAVPAAGPVRRRGTR